MKVFYLLVIFVNTTACFAQTKVKLGFEFGVSLSRLYSKTEEVRLNETTINTITPIVSPIIGFKSQFTINRHIYLSTGIKYQINGYSKKTTSKGTSPDFYKEEDAYTSNFLSINKKVFHQINIPLLIGFKFNNLKNIQPTLFIGYTPNFYLKGEHYKKYKSERDNEKYNNYDYESTNNPLDTKTNYRAVKRLHSQATIGMSTIINEKFEISFTYNYGSSFSYEKFQPIGFCTTGSYSNNSFNPSDYGFSLTYFL